MEVSPNSPDASSAVRPVEATVDCAPVLQVDQNKTDEKSADSPLSRPAESNKFASDNQQQDGILSTLSKAQETPEPLLSSNSVVDSALLNAIEQESQQENTHDVAEVEALLSGESTIDQLLSMPLPAAVSTSTEQRTAHPHPKSDKLKKEKKSSDSFATEETLAIVQQFLIDKITLSQCSSHSKELLEFVDRHLSEKQRRRYVGPMIQRIVEHFATDAQAKGTDVSVDVQTSICLVEQMLLALGRESPLQDMYTQEEEEMLDLLFHAEPDAGELASPS